jgi:hypothetical protein
MRESTPTAPVVPPPAPRPYPIVAALLSLAVPGLGQIFQGLLRGNRSRCTKGVMFLVIIWGMFFYGFQMGNYRNVWLPHKQAELIDREEEIRRLKPDYAGQLANRFWFTRAVMPGLLGDLCQRWQYIGQFWNGVVAWPALWNYCFPSTPLLAEYQPSPGAWTTSLQLADVPRELAERQKELAALPPEGAPGPHDARRLELQQRISILQAAPNDPGALHRLTEDRRRELLRDFEETQNKYEREMDRRWDIAWICTMISGMLNLLVIYDTVANPVIPERKGKKEDAKGDAK